MSPMDRVPPGAVLHGRFGERLLMSGESLPGEATVAGDSPGKASFRSAVAPLTPGN